MIVSVLIGARDEEARLSDCLRCPGGFDEIVVVADRCVDATAAISRRFEAMVVEGAFPLEGRRKEAGLAACSGDWTLSWTRTST